MRPSRGQAFRTAGLALALVAARAGIAAAQDLAAAPEILIDVRVEGGPGRIVLSRVSDTTLHIAAREVLELVGARLLRYAPDTALAFQTDSTTPPVVVETRAGYFTRGGSRVALPAWSATWLDGNLFVEAALLARLLDVRIETDLAGLSVVLRDADHLPAMAAGAQERSDERQRALRETPELLVDVRIERGPRGLVFARAFDSLTLVAAEQVLTIAEVKIAAQIPDTLLGFVLEPSGTRVDIRTNAGYASRDGERRELGPLDAVWIDGVLYVELDVLAALLDVGASANLAELSVTLRNAAHLPAVARAQRERRRRLAREAPADGVTTVAMPRRTPVFDGAVLDWAGQAATSAPAGPGGLRVESGALQLGLGVVLFGGSGTVIHEERWLPGPVNNARRTDVSWTRVWPENRTLKQLRLGDVSGTGQRPRRIRGGAVTNAPFVRPVTFAEGSLTGALPPGWEVELYRQGTLVGLTTTGTDGRYAFDVPLLYGTNPVEVVGYGPTGEVRRFERTFEVPFERLPAGQFEYGIGAGACEFDPCQASGNLDLRYGANRRITLRAGWDQFWRDTLPDLWYPYGSVTYQATRSLALFAEAVGNAQFGGLVSFAPTPNLRSSMGHTRFVGDSVVQPLVGSAMLDDLTTAYLFVRPGMLRGRFYVQADARRAYGPTSRRYDGRVTLTARIPALRVDAGVRVARASLRQAPFVTTTTLTGQMLYQTGPGFGVLRRTIVRGAAELDPQTGLERAVAGIARTLWQDYYADLNVGWDRDVGVVVNFGFKANLPSVRFTSQNRLDDFGAVGLQSAEGSLLYDRQSQRIAAADGRGLGRAGVTGTVFLDLDGNGVRDPGEPPVVGAIVRVGPWVLEADAEGRYTVWDVVPFERLVIEVDPRSASNALWAPAVLRYLLAPEPNQFVPVDIPFVQTAEVAGEVRLDPAGTPLPSIPVVLQPENGGESYRTLTFADGGFYVMGVRPGAYRVTVDPDAQQAFGITAEAVRFVVTPGETTVVEGLIVRVRRN